VHRRLKGKREAGDPQQADKRKAKLAELDKLY
jgi:hypothetical protein